MRYFTEEEFVNPVFDGNPANTWSEMPEDIQKNLKYVWDLLEILREKMGVAIRINSSWRPRGNRKSAHFVGKAVDIQFVNPKIPDSKYIEAMDYMRDTKDFDMFRALLEWQGRRPWIHIDRNFPSFESLTKRSNKRRLRVMHPRNNKMVCKPYESILPQAYVLGYVKGHQEGANI